MKPVLQDVPLHIGLFGVAAQVLAHIFAVDDDVHVRHVAARVEGDILKHLLKERVQPARADILARLVGLLGRLGQRVKRRILKVQVYMVDREQRLVLARECVVRLAKDVPGFEVNVPQGAFYLFPKCSSFYGKSAHGRIITNSDELAMYLLEVGHVACVGGTSFGAPECIRMSYATSDENIVEAIRRIKEALAELK